MKEGDVLLCIHTERDNIYSDLTKNKTYIVNHVRHTRTNNKIFSFKITNDVYKKLEFDEIDVDQPTEVINKYPDFTYFKDVTDWSEEDLFEYVLSN